MSDTWHHINWSHHRKRCYGNNSRNRRLYFYVPMRAASKAALRKAHEPDFCFLVDQKLRRNSASWQW